VNTHYDWDTSVLQDAGSFDVQDGFDKLLGGQVMTRLGCGLTGNVLHPIEYFDRIWCLSAIPDSGFAEFKRDPTKNLEENRNREVGGRAHMSVERPRSCRPDTP
jgi:hypothetical protein